MKHLNVGVELLANAVAYNFSQRIDTVVAGNEPLLTITHSAAGSVQATGPVTFTFDFSLDVGTSFTADDIVLSVGTVTSFTRASGTRSTAVVTLPAGTSGLLRLDVEAGAFASTAGVFATMATLATVIKRDLSGMGRWLFAGMIAILIAAVVNIFIGSSAMMLALTALSTLVFSLYMLYDVKNIIDGGETNYIVAATQLFIDIFAVFQNLLALFGIMGGDD